MYPWPREKFRAFWKNVKKYSLAAEEIFKEISNTGKIKHVLPASRGDTIFSGKKPRIRPFLSSLCLRGMWRWKRPRDKKLTIYFYFWKNYATFDVCMRVCVFAFVRGVYLIRVCVCVLENLLPLMFISNVRICTIWRFSFEKRKSISLLIFYCVWIFVNLNLKESVRNVNTFIMGQEFSSKKVLVFFFYCNFKIVLKKSKWNQTFL